MKVFSDKRIGEDEGGAGEIAAEAGKDEEENYQKVEKRDDRTRNAWAKGKMQGVKRGRRLWRSASERSRIRRGCRCVNNCDGVNTLGGVGLFDAGDFRAIGVSSRGRKSWWDLGSAKELG